MTFWYGPDKFISTQLYDVTAWPPKTSIDRLWEWFDMSKQEPMPKGLDDAVTAVAPHNDAKAVYVTKNAVQAARDQMAAEAIYDVKVPALKGIDGPLMFNAANLSKVLAMATTIHFADARKLYFVGGISRGVLSTRDDGFKEDAKPQPELAPHMRSQTFPMHLPADPDAQHIAEATATEDIQKMEAEPMPSYAQIMAMGDVPGGIPF